MIGFSGEVSARPEALRRVRRTRHACEGRTRIRRRYGAGAGAGVLQPAVLCATLRHRRAGVRSAVRRRIPGSTRSTGATAVAGAGRLCPRPLRASRRSALSPRRRPAGIRQRGNGARGMGILLPRRRAIQPRLGPGATRGEERPWRYRRRVAEERAASGGCARVLLAIGFVVVALVLLYALASRF